MVALYIRGGLILRLRYELARVELLAHVAIVSVAAIARQIGG
jgi:hypothetical protein